MKIKRLFEVIKNMIDHFDEYHNGEPFDSYLLSEVSIVGDVLTIKVDNKHIAKHKDSILVALKRECKDERHNF